MSEHDQDDSGPSLFALVVDVEGDTLVLPNAGVAEVVALDGLRPPDGAAPPWYLGRLPWQGLDVPVTRFDRLGGGVHANEAGPPDRRARVVIVNTVANVLTVGRFGLLCVGYPRLATVDAATLHALPPRPADDPAFVLARADLGGQSVAIPDLARIERALAAVAG